MGGYMATISIYDKLSKKAKEEINKIVSRKENAIDMMVNNYYSDAFGYDSNDVCARLQVQNFALLRVMEVP